MAKVEMTFKSYLKAYLQVQRMNIQKELEAKAALTGALKSDGRVEKISDGYSVVFGDSRVPYARFRHFKNAKNPQTLKYLERAGNQTAKEGYIVMKGDA